MSKRSGSLSDLEKLLQGSLKRRERIKAADEALSKPAEPEPPAPVPAPAPAPAPSEAARVAPAVLEPTEVAPVFSLSAEPHTIVPLEASDDDPLLSMLAGSEADAPDVRELLHGQRRVRTARCGSADR
jgi:hypothetical protein